MNWVNLLSRGAILGVFGALKSVLLGGLFGSWLGAWNFGVAGVTVGMALAVGLGIVAGEMFIDRFIPGLRKV